MASVYRRKTKDGSLSKRWYYAYLDANGKRCVLRGYTDKAATERLAAKCEEEARKERDGLVPRGESERKESLNAPIAKVIERYRDHLKRKGNTEKHITHTVGAIRRVFDSGKVGCLAEGNGEKLQKALGKLREARSARTANHARGAVRGFYRWLVSIEVLPSVPSWVASNGAWNERVDRRRTRRALTDSEVSALLTTTETGPEIIAHRDGRSGPVISTLTGEDRSIAYLIALETGFRANEIRTLTPASFRLDDDHPTIRIEAAYSKHRREDIQPIPLRVADRLREWLKEKPSGEPCLPLPEKAGKMLEGDLRRAGIEKSTSEGVIDFHSLRVTFITNLSRRGVPPHVARELARHSTITLTIDTYTRVDDAEKRKAIE